MRSLLLWGGKINPNPDSIDHAKLLNRIYTWQKYFYDFSRKYYLLGRDRVLNEISSLKPNSVLEVGCGTARNLRVLRQNLPEVKLYGIDASSEMLEFAATSISRSFYKNEIHLKFCLAENLNWEEVFPQHERPSIVFFSYSLSMMPRWEEALKAAFATLNKGGILFVVDFWDLHSFPKLFGSLLRKWLRVFYVEFKEDHLKEILKLGGKEATVEIKKVAGSYAYIAKVLKL